jgi:DNA-binding response OmpR family regulator
MARVARILIVENNPFFADVLADTLGLEEYDVTVANNAGEGVRLGLAAHPDVVIAAWSLRSGISGGEVCQRIRAVWPGTKVVIVAGCPEFVLQAKTYCGGAAAVLAKPFHREELLRAVRRALCGDAAVPLQRLPAPDFQNAVLNTVS